MHQQTLLGRAKDHVSLDERQTVMTGDLIDAKRIAEPEADLQTRGKLHSRGSRALRRPAGALPFLF